MDKLENQVGRFVFGTNSPFQLVEHKEFKALMEMVRPGIKLPGKRAVADRILDSVYQTEWKKFADSVEEKFCTMAVDGWSNIVNDPVVSVLLQNHLVTTVDTTGNPHTGDYLKKLMTQAMEKVSEGTKAVVAGIVTDNASNMENMRAKIQDKNIFTYGCQAHILNLVSKDLMADKGRATMSGFILDILKDFRNKHALLGALHEGENISPNNFLAFGACLV